MSRWISYLDQKRTFQRNQFAEKNRISSCIRLWITGYNNTMFSLLHRQIVSFHKTSICHLEPRELILSSLICVLFWNTAAPDLHFMNQQGPAKILLYYSTVEKSDLLDGLRVSKLTANLIFGWTIPLRDFTLQKYKIWYNPSMYSVICELWYMQRLSSLTLITEPLH